jgi:hypothetical protein
MRIRIKLLSGLLAAAAVGATMTAAAPAYASTTYRYLYVVDASTGTKWYMSNCNNAAGTCTLTTNSKYYGEFSFQNGLVHDGATYYQMVDRETGLCINLVSIDSDLYENTCEGKSFTTEYWHYDGTSEESRNLWAMENGHASQSCLLAWAADPADSTYTYTCGEGWNDQWSQPQV